MYLVPAPKHLAENGMTFSIGSHFKIVLDSHCNFSELGVARILKEEIEGVVCAGVSIGKSDQADGADLFIQKTESAGEDYQLEITDHQIRLSGGERGLFLGTQTFRQIVRQCGAKLPGCEIKDEPYFAVRGFMHDVTRGKVPKLKTLFELADRAAFYKQNQLQLYVEHSFAFAGFSEVYAGKDPLTAEEILVFDEYCAKRRIELVPALATFGHLYGVLSTKSFSSYSELEGSDRMPFSFCDRMLHHTLNVSDDESINIAKQMIDSYLPLFSSKNFNICCDETFDIGKGKSAELAALKGEGKLYIDFLKKVICYVQSKGKKVQFWGDIVLKNPESLRELPDDVDCLYWNYDSNVPEEEVSRLAQAKVPFYGCPGVCGWNKMMNLFDVAYDNIGNMVKYARVYGAKGILCTDWGDYGHVNFFANSMPGLSISAALSWNPEDGRDQKALLRAYGAIEFGENSAAIMDLLQELSGLQVATWADVVCWRESQYTENENAQEGIAQIKNLDEEKALYGYRRARVIESELAAIRVSHKNGQDMKEFICAAQGTALLNAAGLSVKKYGYQCGKEAPLENRVLAAELERWFGVFSELWRTRNKESELYRIRETLFALCSALRDWNE